MPFLLSPYRTWDGSESVSSNACGGRCYSGWQCMHTRVGCAARVDRLAVYASSGSVCCVRGLAGRHVYMCTHSFECVAVG